MNSYFSKDGTISFIYQCDYPALYISSAIYFKMVSNEKSVN